MSDISRKSIGFMIDELVTTCIKHHYRSSQSEPDANAMQQLNERKQALSTAIEQRLQSNSAPVPSTGKLIAELAEVLISCWAAQEKVMSENDSTTVALAAKDAQLLNARRNQLIREIDAQLGEAAITVTSKTYEQS